MLKELLHRLPPPPVPGQAVPFFMQREVLERVLQAALQVQIDNGELAPLERHWLRIEVTDLGFNWYFTLSNHSLVVTNGDIKADVTISGNAREFLQLALRQEDPDTLFFQRRLVIAGDTELGLVCKNMLDTIEPEHLPPWLYQLQTLASGFLRQTGR